MIAGQLKQGKSQLLNSLLNMPVARVGDDEATVLVTVVAYGDPPSARIVLAGPNGEPETAELPVAELQTDLRQAPQAAGRDVLRVEVGAPSPMLQGGSPSSTHPVWAVTVSRTCRRRWDYYPMPTRS